MSKLRWSKNVNHPPHLVAADEFDPREMAYPFFDARKPMNEAFISVDSESVTFIGQRGPVSQNGLNGCQIDDILTFCLGTLRTFNKKSPCRENSIAITKLQECLHWLDERTRDREDRCVEGTPSP